MTSKLCLTHQEPIDDDEECIACGAYDRGYKDAQQHFDKWGGYQQGYRDAVELETRRRLMLEEQIQKMSLHMMDLIKAPAIVACADCPKIKLKVEDN